MLDEMKPSRKLFLAKIAEVIDPDNNIYKESLIADLNEQMLTRAN